MRNMQEIQIMKKWLPRLLALACVGISWSVSAQNAIQSINSTQQAGSEVVRIELSEPLSAAPSGFTVQTPPRVALDLPGVSNATGRASIEINQGNLRSVNIAQAGERTRLVMNLKQAASYKTQLQGKTLLVILESSATASAAIACGCRSVAKPG